jgi:class 3 adenylate cyclase
MRVETILDTFETMSAVASTLVMATKSSWPFVTLPNFDQWTNLDGTGATSISVSVVVEQYQRMDWANYSQSHASLWMDTDDSFTPFVWKNSSNGTRVMDRMAGVAAVSWQTTPADPYKVNYNNLNEPIFTEAFARMQALERPVFSSVLEKGTPSSLLLLQPIVLTANRRNKLVGYFQAECLWETYFRGILPEGTKGIHLVLDNTCGETITWELDGPHVIFLGNLDYHEAAFDDMVIEEAFDSQQQPGSECVYMLRIYPSHVYQQAVRANQQAQTFSITIGILVVLLSAIGFLVYDCIARGRQDKLVSSAKRSLAIVHSLFPATVRDRLLHKDFASRNNPGYPTLSSVAQSYTGSMGQAAASARRWTKPIADLFPATTVMFADIEGFTAWSSVREPSQVFTLLETIYDALDQIAKKRGVFKVETIGDCYVAVVGLPTPRSDHAVVMANFARKCVDKVANVVAELEILLGPGTGDLGMRFGLHSGPVMAGVLRGEKSRFQLFGDTMNTTARIEATGAKNKIHLSQETANLLIEADKADWVKPRETMVTAKGKGKLQTYWLDFDSIPSQIRLSKPRSQPNLSQVLRSAALGGEFGLSGQAATRDKMERLIDYNTQVLMQFLKKMTAMRGVRSDRKSRAVSFTPPTRVSSGTVLDEVKEVIALPSHPAKYQTDPDMVELSMEVKRQLRDFVATVASMYQDNPFHSFDHASHVTMSVTKLLSRVVTPDMIDYTDMKYKTKAVSSKLHEYTFGITSDPLTQFALAFSALIHDLDHQGVPNSQLVKEGAEIAEMYRNQSVAEQNSVDLAWELLMEPTYVNLRQCIYTSQAELDRFRQLVVNAVMATDIIDKDLGALRRRRWDKVFGPDDEEEESNDQDSPNRKATIVIEHLIQASDVAHTMQHWHVYLKWNKLLFEEMYLAHKTGRSDNEPSETWYQGELGFFDHYIIPLAKKLKECGVFGVSSDEYLEYAVANRKEWELKGRDVVQDYLADFFAKSASAEAAAASATRKLSSGESRRLSFNISFDGS